MSNSNTTAAGPAGTTRLTLRELQDKTDKAFSRIRRLEGISDFIVELGAVGHPKQAELGMDNILEMFCFVRDECRALRDDVNVLTRCHYPESGA